MNKTLGEQLKDINLDRIESSQPEFLDTMRAKGMEISRVKGFVTTDDLREAADSLGIIAESPNHWGCVLREPMFKTVGMTRSRRPSNHGRRIFKWRAA